jgi:histidyl-tRNA synthetase
MKLVGPKGTNDILPSDVESWIQLEQTVRNTFVNHGYKEIRLPIFEHTEVFSRSVGSTTDIVEKQMYSFVDQGNREITLRPEGTAQVVRSYLQHSMYKEGLPVKLFYMGPMFRYERPQSGRYRQFHQFGAEAFGSSSPMLDVEMIAIPLEIYRKLEMKSFRIDINSIGCAQCRPAYLDRLVDYYEKRQESLCPTCLDRLNRNPLRILDCKSEQCKEVSAQAPKSFENLCGECDNHFQEVKTRLETLSIDYQVNPYLVRGLDYYTRTVFEIIGLDLGAQDAMGGGGRYDRLVEECGGPPTPAVGFAQGMERVLLNLKAKGQSLKSQASLDLYLAAADDVGRSHVLRLAFLLRSQGLSVEMDYLDRSLKAQMRTAEKAGAKLCIILGERELKELKVMVKEMDGGQQWPVFINQLGSFCLEKLRG